jgi:hypothetical protein
VTSGDRNETFTAAPPALRAQLHDAARAAYGKGFAGAAALLATAFAAGTCALTFLLIDNPDDVARIAGHGTCLYIREAAWRGVDSSCETPSR